MPMVKKIMRMGESSLVVLPKPWIEYYEKKFGQKISKVEMEVNSKITIKPIKE